jgi:2',3'-cyclic-nucleotide 2'-phosphodiesterase (5'-nucleotidase family)
MLGRALIFLIAIAAAWSQDVRRLSILHSKDLHARLLPDANGEGGWAHLASLVRKERAGCGHCVYVHAGDLVQGTPVSTIFRGTPLYEIANKLGFDMATLGNHEFDYGDAQVPVFLRKAKFPVVTSNIVDGSGALLTKRGVVIKKVNGLRIAFIGAVMGNLVEGFLMPDSMGPWKSLPVVETVNRYAADLDDKADLFVVVGHILDAEGTDLLKRAPKVSIVVQGHNHAGSRELEVYDNRIAANGRGYGVELGRLDVEYDRTARKLVAYNWKRIPVKSADIPAAVDVKKLIDKWEKRVSEVVDVPIGETNHDWTPQQVKLLIERSLREEGGADIAYTNQGGVRDRLPKGQILARHIWNIMPFDNRVALLTVRGARVPEALRRGMTIEADRDYKIMMPDFAATNETERQRLGLGDLKFKITERKLRDLIIDWVKKKKIL